MNSEQDLFIKRLTELMEEFNMTQVELAQKVDITNVTISRYLSGERSPRIEIVTKIAKILNTTTDYLLGVTNIRRPMVSQEEFMNILLDSEFAKKVKPLTDEQKKTLESLIDVWTKENNEKKEGK